MIKLSSEEVMDPRGLPKSKTEGIVRRDNSTDILNKRKH